MLMVSVFAGNVEDINKFSRRTVRMTRDHQEDCKRLLSLMGMPVITVRWMFL